MHQKPAKQEWDVISKGEAHADAACDEARPACQKQEGLGREDWLKQDLSCGNMATAWNRVKANNTPKLI